MFQTLIAPVLSCPPRRDQHVGPYVTKPSSGAEEGLRWSTSNGRRTKCVLRLVGDGSAVTGRRPEGRPRGAARTPLPGGGRREGSAGRCPGLAGPFGESTMTLQQLLNHTAVAGYASVTVREAVAEHARAGDGCLTRLRMGVFRLRQEGDARAW